MTRFHDPHACPDCGAALADGLTRCPACHLPLTGEVAVRLGTTLRLADDLLDQLRLLRTTAPGAAPAAAVPAALPAYPVPARRQPDRSARGLRPVSVPAILLGLGATCLVVAAIIFLAVAWSWLGLGGRTAVLVGLTGIAAAASRWLGGRELWIAAEALTVVTLGLLMVALAGAAEAGWISQPGHGLAATWYGGALAVAALLLMLGRTRLVVPQLAVVAGACLMLLGIGETTDAAEPLLAAAGVLVCAGLGLLGVALAQQVLPWAAVVTAGWCWLGLVVLSLEDALLRPDLRNLWVDGAGGWWLLLAAALLLLPATAWPEERLLPACVAAAALLAGAALALPVIDEGASAAVMTAIAVLVTGAAVARVLGGRWALVPLPSLAVAALPALLAALWLLATASVRVLTAGDPFTESAGLRLAPAYAGGPHPLLLVPAVAALLAATAAVLPSARRRAVALAGIAASAAAGLATLALHEVPLWTVVAALLVVAAVAVVLGTRRPLIGTSATATALVLAAMAGVAALPSASLATAAAAATAALAAWVHLTSQDADGEEQLLGGLVLPVALAATVWCGGEALGTAGELRGVLAVALVGTLAVGRHRPEVEISALAAALATSVAGVGASADQSTWLAVHLTVVGAFVCATSLVHPDRREAGWLGGALLAAATWVRLADLGVDEPEPYTLPTAAALIVLGLVRLHRDTDAVTTATLTPGLVLATVPSLLWALTDPVSVRAALLGLGCLVLVLAGASLRWSAPLLVGAAVGGVLVVWQLWPYVLATPQWVVIGVAGTLLTVVGVTWEHRLRELRRAATYVGALR